MADLPQDIALFSHELSKATENFKDISREAGITGNEIKEVASLSTQLNAILKDTINLSAHVGQQYIKIGSLEKGLLKTMSSIHEVEARIQVSSLSAKQKQYKALEEAIKKYHSIHAVNKTILGLNNQIAVAQQKGLDTTAQQLALQTSHKQLGQHTGDLNKLLQQHPTVNKLGMLNIQKHIAGELLNIQTQQLATQKQYNSAIAQNIKKVSSLPPILKGISKIPILGGLFQPGKFIQALKGFGVSLAIKDLIQGSISFEKNITDSANGLAISKASVQSIYKDFERITLNSTKYADNLDRSFLSVSNQGRALNELQASLGTNGLLSDNTIQNQILLTKQMGMTVDEAGQIQKFALTNNSTAEQTLQTIVKQNKSLISYRRVISEVASIGGQLLAQYKNSPLLLSQAVVQANKLGISLQQAKQASGFLLDFQSSIESELEAELLTGRSINLEKARSLSLDGKASQAAAEMLKQVGSFNEFSRLNVIQQNSLAKSIGMSSDELSNALREQQTLTSLGYQNKEALQNQYDLLKKNHDLTGLTRLQEEIRAKANGDVLLSQISQVSLQQRFQESIEKIKDTFASVASGPLIKIMNGLAGMVSHASTLKFILKESVVIMGALAARSAAVAIAQAAGAAAMTPIIGLAAGLSAAAIMGAAMNNVLNQKVTPVNDGVIAPDGRISINTPEGGLIVPNRRDSIVATTQPNALLNGGGNTAMLVKMDKMIALLNRGGDIFLDSERIGTTLARTNYNLA